MPARILTCTDDEYHADPCMVPSLSYSTAALLITVSPRAAHYYHPRLGGHHKERTEPMRLGTVMDALLLGGEDRIVEFEIEAWRKTVDKEARKLHANAGRIPVKTAELQRARERAISIERTLWDDFQIALDGDFQVAIEWEEESSLGPVVCRCKLDHLRGDTIDDIKATADARPDKIHRAAIANGYDIQAAAYTSALEHLRPELVGRVKFRDLYCHMADPVDVVPVLACSAFLEFGQMRWRRAVERWARCMRYNVWPGMVDRIIPAEVPAWVMQREYEAQEDLDSEET